MLGDPCRPQTQSDRCDRRSVRPLRPAGHPRSHPLRQRTGVCRRGRAGMDRSCRNQDRLHRARQSLGERLLVGSTALAEELKLLGPKYTDGVIVTQVVPAIEGYSSLILAYKAALAKYFPGEVPDYVSLEGYIAAGLLAEGLKRAGPQLDTEKVVEALENLRDFDMGLGTPLVFGRTEHQGSHKVWGTQLDAAGRYQAIDLQ